MVSMDWYSFCVHRYRIQSKSSKGISTSQPAGKLKQALEICQTMSRQCLDSGQCLDSV